MRVLCTTVPALGHLNRVLHYAHALRAAGHEVAFAAVARALPTLDAAGFQTFESGRLETVFEIADRMGVDFWGLAPDQQTAFTLRHMLAGEQIAQGIGDLLELCERWRPDLILHEQAEFSAPIAAERLGLPHVAIQVFMRDIPANLGSVVAERLDSLRAWAGLPSDPASHELSRYLWLCPFPRRFRWSGIPTPVTLREVRHVPFDGTLPPPPDAWFDSLPAAGSGPRVYVTLGTVWGAPQVFETIIAGLVDEAASIVVTVGPGGDPAVLGTQPPHVRIEQYVPQTMMMSRSDLVVCHGGSGTVMAALDAAVPLVIIPLAADQGWNADALAAHGVARVVLPADLTATVVREASLAAMCDPSSRRQALQREIRAMPGPGRVVEWLEWVARERAPLDRESASK